MIPQQPLIPEITHTETSLKRSLTLLDTVMLNMGSMIGSGIFFVPAVIALALPVSSLYLGVWLLGGLISLFGALSIAELGAAMPQAGGYYVYLKRAYGPICGFMSGWTSLALIMTASIAAVSVASAQCINTFLPMPLWTQKLLAVGILWALTGINILGVRYGVRVQNALTALKIVLLVALVVFGIVMPHGNIDNFQPIVSTTSWLSIIQPFGIALVAVIWAFDGWIQVAYIAEEVKSPQKNLPRAFLISILGVALIYTIVNAVYIYHMPLHRIAHSTMVAGDIAHQMLGAPGRLLISVGILISTMGANNGYIFSGARIYYAMAKRGHFFPKIAHLTKNSVPANALLLQAGWASVLALTGSFEQLFTYSVFASWLFYALTAGAVIVMRNTEPEMPRPYKTWGYPFVPILFILFSLGLVVNTLFSKPVESAIGLVIILLGLPVYYYCEAAFKTKAPNS